MPCSSLAPRTTVQVRGDELMADGLVVQLLRVRSTRNRPPPDLPAALDFGAAAALLAPGAARSAFGAWWELDPGCGTGMLPPMRRRARAAIQQVNSAVRMPSPDEDALIRATSRLQGLGMGATPSGDDFLVGFLAAWLWLGSDRALVLRLAAELSAQAPTRTTRVAAEFYYHLSRARVSSPLETLLTAIASGDQDGALSSVAALGCYGATSGWDTIAGIHAYLLALSGRIAWNVES